MNLIASFNKENVSEEEAKKFHHRRAARGIVFDDDKKIALLYAKNKGYYGLPGGGVHNEETYEQGIVRECKEEIGCNIEIITCVGTTLEYRKQNSLLNESWCYVARVIGPKGTPLITGDEDESEINSEIVWVSLTEAIKLIESISNQGELYSQYIRERDLAFLRAVSVKYNQ